MFIKILRNTIAQTIALIVLLTTLLIITWMLFLKMFGAPIPNANVEQFTLSPNGEVQDLEQLARELKTKGYIKNERAFKFAFMRTSTNSWNSFFATNCVDCFDIGSYKISKGLNAWEIANILSKTAYLKWVIIPEGLRKEQIAEIIAGSLKWNEAQIKEWIEYTNRDEGYFEGVYFPDTYLVPSDEEPKKVAARFISRFEEKFKPFAEEAEKQNIKWTTVVTMASILQREAAGKYDMDLIAGVLWNRLEQNMRLEIDATVQYVRDNITHYGTTTVSTRSPQAPTENYTREGSWWGAMKPNDKFIISPFNTYRNEGLPPHAISNAGVNAFNAVLHPEKTECLYYLHAHNREIYCAKTYSQHLRNIDAYLR
jgi:UPF0755 protein